jgi:exodeoxyribonuclease VII large subunit
MIDNVPEFSVSDLSRAVKKTMEGAFSHVRVRGELSRVTLAKSGHLYSDLKDENAVLNVVCWKGTVQKLSLRPEEGMDVICTGRMTTFPGSSRYQLIIEGMELAGEGALLKMLEQRKKALAAEGLFDEGGKKPLPFMPRIIGVVTSPTGAVIRDIIHRIRDRFPCHIIVWPVQVQGTGAADQVTKAIKGFNRVQSENRPDLIIVARGGGSLEDLMAFNEENVVRATAESDIPIISAVGHETDVTLIDFASDRRAPTPTGAAEMAVPVLENLMAQVIDDGLRLTQIMKRMADVQAQNLKQITRTLDNPLRMIEPLEQRTDAVTAKLDYAFQTMLSTHEGKLSRLSGAIQTPRSKIEKAEIQLTHTGEKLTRMRETLTQDEDIRLNNASRMLETLSYKNILQRGFAVLKDSEGQVLETAQALKSTKTIEAIVKDGAVIIR